jgi:hypothetical protein
MANIRNSAFGSNLRIVRRAWRAIVRLSPKLLSFAFLVFLSSVSVGQSPWARQNNDGNSGRTSGEALASALQISTAAAGSNRCAFCHPAEVEGYARSTMAHSLRRAAHEPDGTVNASGSRITMHSSAAGFFQRWENRGETIEYRIEYVIGSGAHASGYLTDIGGHLFQSPVAFYSSRQSYDLAPGYEDLANPDFTRPVTEECLLCHSGTALYVPGSLNQYRSPVFLQNQLRASAATALLKSIWRTLVRARLSIPQSSSQLPATASASSVTCLAPHVFSIQEKGSAILFLGNAWKTSTPSTMTPRLRPRPPAHSKSSARSSS